MANSMAKEKKSYSLYRHTSPSGKVYIGITSQPVGHRWNHGKGYMNAKKTPFKSTIIKYGWDNIRHEVLFTNLSEEQAKRLEIELVRHYKNLGISLNYTDGGDGLNGCIPWNKGIKVPYEQSNKRKGSHLTDEHKLKLSIAHKGKPIKGHKWTEAQRTKLISKLKGRHHTEETKNKISRNHAMSRRVVELDSSGDTVNIFNSAVDAGKFYNIDGGWVSRACRERLMCCGHLFMYEDDPVEVSEIKYGRHKAGNSIRIINIETGEIKDFKSESSCARFLGLNGTTSLRKAIKKGYLVKKVWSVLMYNGETMIPKERYTINKPKRIACKNIYTGETVYIPSISKCKEFLELNSDCSIKKALNGIRRTNIIKDWEVNYAA